MESLEQKLTDSDAAAYYENFLNTISDLQDANTVAGAFNEYISQAAKRSLKLKICNPKRGRFPRNNWFGDECKLLRKEYKTAMKSNDLNALQDLDLNYKRIKQRKKRQHQYNLCATLGNMKDAAQKLKLLKDKQSIVSCKPDIDSLSNQFSGIEKIFDCGHFNKNI